MKSETIEIGPCECGGYGQVFNESAANEVGVCHRDLDGDGFFGHTVTAKIKGKEDCRQGIVISTTPLIVRGASGEEYECEGKPVKVELYPVQEAGEWIKPVMTGYKFQCCDCKLIHNIDFKVVKRLPDDMVEDQDDKSLEVMFKVDLE